MLPGIRSWAATITPVVSAYVLSPTCRPVERVG